MAKDPTVSLELRAAPAPARTLDVFGETLIIRRDPGGDTLDCVVIEEIVPAGVAAPLHRHTREDEISYVIEGEFRIWRGEEAFEVGPGDVALLPRCQVHTFKNIGAGPARLLTVIQPSGLERFFEAVAERRLGDGDEEEIVAVAATFGLEIFGPPPA